MRCIRELSEYHSEQSAAVTFGKFDGLHTGHKLLVDRVKLLSETEQLTSVVCAFDMTEFLMAKDVKPEILMTPEERARHLDGQVDYLVNYMFTSEFSAMEPEAFIKEIILGVFHAKHVVVGSDFRFGRYAKGNIETLKAYAKECNYTLHVIEKKQIDHRDISSTFVKEILSDGDIKKVNQLLGYPYEVTGCVVHGKRLGRNLGFPTINVNWPEFKIAPPKGVYFVDVMMDKGCYHAIANIGVKPTVSNENRMAAECFLFDYSGDAYDHEVVIKLHEFRRPEVRFEDIEHMQTQVNKDIKAAKDYFGLD